MRSIFPDKMPRWIQPVVILMFVLSWVPLAMIAVERAVPSKTPRPSVIPDMDHQEKYKPQAENALFADGRAMRPFVAGTVPYLGAKTDDWLYRGIKDGNWASDFPLQPSAELMERGRERYTIYCAVCHGHSGYGDGMVARRADELAEGTWIAPTSLHDQVVRDRPVGHLFNTITNGIRTMPPYGPQIIPEDRWAIILYVKALQRSQGAALSDVGSAEDAQRLETMRLPAQQAESAAADSEASGASAGTEGQSTEGATPSDALSSSEESAGVTDAIHAPETSGTESAEPGGADVNAGGGA